MLDATLRLDPRVAIRPEPFGALAYHSGNRRLVFLRHPDVLRVVEALGDHDTVAEALTACSIEATRWPAFVRALDGLVGSEVLREHVIAR